MVHRLRSDLARVLKAKEHELRPLLGALLCFFFLTCGSYLLRPVRDEMGIQSGVEHLQWLFTGTFAATLVVVPLFGWAVRRYGQRRFVPGVYLFFVLHLLGFYLLFQSEGSGPWVARAFFVWLSVFSLFTVSVFWSLMADLFAVGQTRRLFGSIAAGGSAGAIAGPSLAAALARSVGPVGLLPIAAAFLIAVAAGVHLLARRPAAGARPEGEAVPSRPALPAASEKKGPGQSNLLAGAARVMRSPYLLAASGFIALYAGLSTFLYFEQARIVEAAFSQPGRRTALFAMIDLGVGVMGGLAQLFVTARVVERFGVPAALVLVPFVTVAGFAALGLFPALAVVVAFQVVRRAGSHAVTRPVREMLFAPLKREDQYASKNFIDTVVYRGGDVVGAWAFTGLAALGFGLSAVAFAALPVAVLWIASGLTLGQRHQSLRRSEAAPGEGARDPAPGVAGEKG